MKAAVVLDHTSEEDLALFVMGALEAPARRRLEAHVAGCASCAQALRTEAAAEIELRAAWPRLPRAMATVVPMVAAVPRAASVAPAATPPAAHIARRKSSYSSFTGFAAAAVALLFAGSWLQRAPSGGDPPMAFSSIAACFASPGGETSEDDVPACGLDTDPGPSLAALASWGTCTRPSPATAFCALPEGRGCATP